MVTHRGPVHPNLRPNKSLQLTGELLNSASDARCPEARDEESMWQHNHKSCEHS